MFLEDDLPCIRLDPIETPRLLLRKMTMRDARDVYAYSKDEQVAKYVLWDAQESLSEAKSYIRYMLRKYRAGDAASWGIEYKETGHLIGTVGYMWYQKDNNASEVGYSLAREYWNQGIMTEALKAVIRYSFEELHMHRVEAQYEIENVASGKVMEKCGMHCEGILRGRLFNKGKYRDVKLYSILSTDPQRT